MSHYSLDPGMTKVWNRGQESGTSPGKYFQWVKGADPEAIESDGVCGKLVCACLVSWGYCGPYPASVRYKCGLKSQIFTKKIKSLFVLFCFFFSVKLVVCNLIFFENTVQVNCTCGSSQTSVGQMQASSVWPLAQKLCPLLDRQEALWSREWQELAESTRCFILYKVL